MGYKKRAKKAWNCGKRHKHDSNKSERMYESEQVRKELLEYEAGDDFRHKHTKKKKTTEKSRLAKHIKWCERAVERYKESKFNELFSMFDMTRRYQSWLKEAKGRWNKKFGSK